MNARISKHAEKELIRRVISREALNALLEAPEQKVPGHGDITCYQSRIARDGKPHLLRAMVDDTKQPPVVLTVYRTSKITKYWTP